MSTKSERIIKIKNFLRMQSGPVTLTAIHEALTRRLSLEVSRKTIERDMIELVEREVVTATEGVPSRYILNAPNEVEIYLKVDELQKILQAIDSESDLFRKLNKLLIL
jgi:predicted DNA-binding transcriptional regulator YafY